MQPHLTTKEGNVIPLTEEVYESILKIVRDRFEQIAPADSVEALESEFADLLTDSVSTDELLTEHRQEAEREMRKLERLH
jgi:hypothetical protein